VELPAVVRSSRSTRLPIPLQAEAANACRNVLDTIPPMVEYADPAPDIVVLFDDVLKPGSHFKRIEIVGRALPWRDGLSLFLARVLRPPNDETFNLDF